MGKSKKTQYLTPKEASDFAQVSVSTIYTWLDKGLIEGATVGGTKKFVDRESLIKHLGPDFQKVKAST